MTDCSKCVYQDSCTYFDDDSLNKTEEQLFEDNCIGCACGEGLECNREMGCDNYEERQCL